MVALLSVPSLLDWKRLMREQNVLSSGMEGRWENMGKNVSLFFRGFTKNRRDGLCRTAKAAFLRIAVLGVGCAALGGVQSVTTQLCTGYIFISM